MNVHHLFKEDIRKLDYDDLINVYIRNTKDKSKIKEKIEILMKMLKFDY